MKRFEPTTIALMVLIGLYLLYAGSLIPVASENIRMVAAFSIDESDILFQIDHLYRAGITIPPSFTYGGMLYYPVTLILYVWNLFGDVDGQAVILALRWFCALTGVGCLILTYRLGSGVFDRMTGLAGASILALSPEFLRWTVDGHPDLPQLFWILGALLFCCHRSHLNSRHVVAAAGCAGLAFGTKYGGAFLLPVIAMAAMSGSDDAVLKKGRLFDNLREPRRWTALVAAAATFALVFAVTNPWSVLRFESFVSVMGDYKEWMQFGHTRREGGGWFTWMELLYRSLGPAHAVAIAILGAVSARALVYDKTVRRDRLILAFWCLLYLAYLMSQVALRRPRHLLPIFPVVLLFAAWFYRKLAEWLCTKWEWIPGVAASGGVVVCVVLLSFAQIADSSSFYSAKRQQMASRADDIDVGRWLETSAPITTSIVYDAYAYIPPQFQRVWRSTGTTYMMVTHFRPDLLIVRDGAGREYADPNAGSKARMGEEAYGDVHFFYRYLKEGRFADYGLHRRFGSVAVHRRTVSPPDRTARWRELAVLYQQGKLYDIGFAFETMARIHADLGLEEQAAQAAGRGVSSKADAVALYDRTIDLLSRGRVEEATETWKSLLTGMASRPVREVGLLRHHMAGRFAEAGYLAQAIEEAAGAVASDPTFSEAAFDLGLYHAAAGHGSQAMEMYTNAVKSFGPDEAASRKLRSLRVNGRHAEIAGEILRRVFGQEERL